MDLLWFAGAGRRSAAVALVAAGAVLSGGPARGGVLLTPGLYQLHNHPDVLEQPPPYGLRLDELINVTAGHDIFTFDFDHAGASVFLELTSLGGDDFSMHIYGTAYGGLDIGGTYNPMFEGFAQLDFTYGLASTVAGDDDIWVTTPSGTNSGSVDFLAQTFSISDQANADGFTFRFGDEDDDQGHRNFPGISGWGWLRYPSGHVENSDWLFTAVKVPTPGALSLLAMAALVAVPRRRR